MRRLAVAGGLAGIVLLGSAGQAAPPRPQLVDARGDAVVASGDIVSALLSTATVRGRDVLQIEVTYAAPVTDGVPQTRGVTFVTGGCRFSATQYAHGTGLTVLPDHEVGCASAAAPHRGTAQANGAVLTFRIPLHGPDLRRGARLTELAAFTHPGGAFALHTPLTTAGDTAEGGPWTIG